MGLFNFIIKRILSRIPLKLLILILIALLLIFLFNSKVFAINLDTTTYNGNTYTRYIPDNAWGVFTQLPEYTSGSYDYLLWCSGGRCYIYFWSNNNSQRFYNNIAQNGNNYNGFSHELNDISCHYYNISENGTTVPTTYETRLSSQMGVNCYSVNSTRTAYFFTNLPVYTDNTFTEVFWEGLTPTFIDPYISDTSSIDDMSFNYLMIEGGSEDFYFINTSEIQRQRIFDLELDYQGYTYVMNINDYAVPSSSGDSVGFAIPKYALFPQLIFRNGETLSFSLVVTPSKQPNSTGVWSVYSLGTFTLTLTTEQEQQLEEDRQAQQMDNIENGINNINNSVTNVNNSVNNLTDAVTDSDIDDDYADDFLDLSTNFAVQDPTSLDQIFMILYNAFCEDEIEDVTFTMPFTNQQVTISQQNISARYPQAVKSIVAVFVWGIIGLFVLKDIRSSVNKIAEGSPEDVGSDVKKEVL